MHFWISPNCVQNDWIPASGLLRSIGRLSLVRAKENRSGPLEVILYIEDILLGGPTGAQQRSRRDLQHIPEEELEELQGLVPPSHVSEAEQQEFLEISG